MSYCTLIYGLKVQINKQIPGVAPFEFSATPPDVIVELGTLPSWFDPKHVKKEIWHVARFNDHEGDPRLTIWEISGRKTYHFCYADGTEFLVDFEGTSVWATWPPGTLTLADTATYLLGPIMGFVLLLRGHISLHASAVAIEGSAVAFVGPAGAGKSTTAAALANLGFRVLAEDVVTIRDIGSSFFVEPGYPCIRLWPEAVAALYGSDAELPKLTPTWDKRFLDLTQAQYQFQTNPLPLVAVYIVGERSAMPNAPRVETISHSEALMSLVSNTYATHLMKRQMRGKEFQALTRLLKTATVRRLIPHSDSARINALCQTIITDFEGVRYARLASQPHAEFLHV